MRWILVIAILLIGCGTTWGQEQHSVLVNPPPLVPQVQPQSQPPPTFLIRRGLFGWRAVPLYPVRVVVVQPAPRPVVVWQPWLIWR